MGRNWVEIRYKLRRNRYKMRNRESIRPEYTRFILDLYCVYTWFILGRVYTHPHFRSGRVYATTIYTQFIPTLYWGEYIPPRYILNISSIYTHFIPHVQNTTSTYTHFILDICPIYTRSSWLATSIILDLSSIYTWCIGYRNPKIYLLYTW